MKTKSLKSIIDSRNLKILSAKKDDLKNSVVFISYDCDISMDQYNRLQNQLIQLEPTASYCLMPNNLNLTILDKEQIRNRQISVVVSPDSRIPNHFSCELAQLLKTAFPEAKDVSVVYVVAGAQNPITVV